ncbi:MAG: hypothetical protein J0H63_09820 [Rhizobiales bacterium]|nr:hypothetical protein [Hyphomicrobiales bacterium]
MTDATSGAAPIRRRLVLFMHGFDPRGLKLPYRIFATEIERHKARTGATGSVTSVTQPDPSRLWLKRWTAHLTEPDEPEVETTFDFLEWQDLIPRRKPFRFFRMTWAGIVTFVQMLRYGIYPKMRAYARSHVAFGVFPFAFLALYLWIMWSLVWAGYTIGRPHGGWYATLGTAIGIGLAAAFYWLTLRLDRFLYVWYSIALWDFQWRHGSRGMPGIDERLDAMGRYVEEKLRDPAYDEIALIAVSTGAYYSVEMLAPVLARDPALAGCKLAFLTFGSQPAITSWFGPRKRFVEGMRAIFSGNAVAWHAYAIRGDFMSAVGFDPFRESYLDPALHGRNPIIHHTLYLKRMITPETRKALGWKFLTIHLYYLMAGETGEEHDFFAILCGPRPVLEEAEAWRLRAEKARRTAG